MGAEGYKQTQRGPRGAPGGIQKQVRNLPGSEIREILKIKPFLKENIGFGRSRGAPGDSGRIPGRCLREHFGVPWMLRAPLVVPGYDFGGPLGPPGALFSSIWDPKGAFRGKLFNFS